MTLPPFPLFPHLTSAQISLSPIEDTDCEILMEISYYDGIQAKTLEEAITMQSKINEDYRNGNSIHWGIVDNTTKTIVGTCGYYRGFANGAGELGCVLLPQYRGQGFMTPAMELAINFGLHTMGLNRIWAATTTQNLKAVNLLERLYFIKVAELEDDEIEYELRADKNLIQQ